MIDDHQFDVVIPDDIGHFLDLSGAEQRRGPHGGQTHDGALDDVQVDGPGQADRLVEPLLGGMGRGAGLSPVASAIRLGAVAVENRNDDIGSRWRVRGRIRIDRRVSANRTSPCIVYGVNSREGYSSPSTSIKFTGWPGMIVEMACL